MAVQYTDNFNIADVDPVPAPWTSLGTGTWRVLSNELVCNNSVGGTPSAFARYENPLDSGFHTAEVDYTNFGTQPAYWGGVCVRFAAAALDCYAFFWQPSGTLYIDRIDAGVRSLLASVAHADAVPIRLRLVVTDDGAGGVDLEGFVDGVSRLTANDPAPLPATNVRAGVIGRNSASNPARLDNFLAKDNDYTAPAGGGLLLAKRKLLLNR